MVFSKVIGFSYYDNPVIVQEIEAVNFEEADFNRWFVHQILNMGMLSILRIYFEFS